MELPLLARDLLRRAIHIITEPMTKTVIPRVTPIMVGTFEVDAEDKSDAGIGRDELGDADEEGGDGDGVGELTATEPRQDVLVSVRTKKGEELWTMPSIGMIATKIYHP